MKNLRRPNQRQADTLPGLSVSPDFEQLYRRCVDKVFRTCLAISKDPASAKDYTQDIFPKAFEKMGSFQNHSSFSTWLYAIFYNHCLTQLKQESHRKTQPITETHAAQLVSDETTETKAADLVEAQWQVQDAALNQLSPDELRLLRLKYEQELSIRQISQQYNLSESAVKMRLKRSRHLLLTMFHYDPKIAALTPT